MRQLGLILLLVGFCHSSLAFTIASAANFKPTLVRLVERFEALHPTAEIKIVSASSGMLHTQIQQGAPFDIYLSADASRPKSMENKSGNKSFVYALGRLVFWQRDSSISNKDSLLQYEGRLAIANPKIAPYGSAAMETLQSLNLSGIYQNRLIRGNNVNQSYQFIYSGNVGAGLISRSQVIQGKHSNFWLVPKESHNPIEQRGILLNSKDNFAPIFVKYLQSGFAKEIIIQSGYDLPHDLPSDLTLK